MRRARVLRAVVAGSAVAATGVVVVPAAAVTGGDADDYHSYVAAVIPGGARHPTCSGVWTDIGGHRRVVVTDAHCVAAARGARVRVFFGTRWTSGARTLAGRSYRHPSYDGRTHHDDVAVILLYADPHVAAARLAPIGSATRSAQVTTVGFGAPHAGQRRQASEVVTSWSSWRLYLRPGSGNSCDGDSGGPDLTPGTRQIVALTDEGTCSRDEDTRLDAGSARSFVTGPH